MKVLYLSEWYPNRYDAMSGLFVRKHALSCARQGIDVCVLYICQVPDEDQHTLKDTEIVVENTESVTEIYVYHNDKYLSALVRGWTRVKKQWGMPDLCQLNVITKNAILPLWLKIMHGTPYSIIEHWTGYLPANPQYQSSGPLHKAMTRLATRLADIVMPVSAELMRAMKQCGLKCRKWQVINNVVDDFFYGRHKPERTDGTFNLLHISDFGVPHKNVNGILRAAHAVSQHHSGFRLTLVGNGPDYQKALDCAAALGFAPETLRWTGELQPKQVAQEFDKADAFVLFSNYENAAVVLSEALATGVPVISTPVGFATEIVDSATGLLVPVDDEAALRQAIENMMDNLQRYDRSKIEQRGAQFSMAAVGKQLADIYKQCVKH